jgi:hypothetical protein
MDGQGRRKMRTEQNRTEQNRTEQNRTEQKGKQFDNTEGLSQAVTSE